MYTEDHDFFARRLTAERELARSAATRVVAALHLQMAQAYEALLSDSNRATGADGATVRLHQNAGETC